MDILLDIHDKIFSDDSNSDQVQTKTDSIGKLWPIQSLAEDEGNIELLKKELKGDETFAAIRAQVYKKSGRYHLGKEIFRLTYGKQNIK